MNIKKVYIGFAVDMDRAYDTNTRTGISIKETHPKFQERLKHKEMFVNGMNKLFEYFKSIDAEKGVTWFVNEASYMTTIKFPEILKKCVDTEGEIGLHTHFNSSMFNSSQFTMPDNSNAWEKEGIIEPKKRLENFLQKINAKQSKVIVFKSGNHIRNMAMFEKIIEHEFEIDTTCVCNYTESRIINNEDVILFNDDNITNEPFEFKTICGNIFEIPEIHCRQNIIDNSDVEYLYVRLQIHPWEAFENHLKIFDNLLNYIKSKNIKIQFANCKEMKNIYLKYNTLKNNNINVTTVNIDKILYNFENLISTTYYNLFLDDPSPHYKNLVIKNKIFGTDDLYLIKYINHNFNKKTKCLDLFAGIGQCAMGLDLLKFTNTGLLEFDKYRYDLTNKICQENNLNVHVIYDDFFVNKDLFNYDLIFSNNAVATVLSNNIDKQLDIYKKFLNSNGNKDIIINADKYGSESNNQTNISFYKIMLELNKYKINMIKDGFYRISNYNFQIPYKLKFSNYFLDYNLINNNNIIVNIVNDHKNTLYKNLKALKVQFDYGKKNNSFGVYFPIKNTTLVESINTKDENIDLKHKTIFSFYARSNSKCKLKIYTGDKWINIMTELNDDYQLIEISDIFNFESSSTYRIGIQNINDLTNDIFILNPTLLYIYEIIENYIKESDKTWLTEFNSIENYDNIYGSKSQYINNYLNRLKGENINYKSNNTEYYKLFEKTKLWGYINQPNLDKIKNLFQHQDILDVGMGQGPYALYYIHNGCKSYTGVDPGILLDGSFVRDHRIGGQITKKNIDYNILTDQEKEQLKNLGDEVNWYHNFGYTPKNIMDILPNVKLHSTILENCIDKIKLESKDLVMLHCVTEHLNHLPEVIESCWTFTRKNGKIYISHGNYYSWAGHHNIPREPEHYDKNNKKHNIYIDWQHYSVLNPAYHDTNLNRVRLFDLKKLIEKYYIIEYWQEDLESEIDRLTKKIRDKWNNYTLSEMLTNVPIIIGRKRDVPLDYKIIKELYFHPKQLLENEISNLVLDSNFKHEELMIKLYRDEFIELKFNKNEITMKFNYEENELNNKKVNSLGLHFLVAECIFDSKKKYKLSFEAKATNDISVGKNIKIYTGYKWIIIEKNLTNSYQIFEWTDYFNINTKSKYRIGIENICNDFNFNLKNISLIHND